MISPKKRFDSARRLRTGNVSYQHVAVKFRRALASERYNLRYVIMSELCMNVIRILPLSFTVTVFASRSGESRELAKVLRKLLVPSYISSKFDGANTFVTSLGGDHSDRLGKYSQVETTRSCREEWAL